MSVKEAQDKDIVDSAAAASAADDDDDDDSEYFEDASGSMPSLDELQEQIVGVVGESLFNRVFGIVQVLSLCYVL